MGNNLSLEDVNPGQLLREELQALYPLRSGPNHSFISMFDECLEADGEFVELSYQSGINFLVRRLITVAVYMKRKYVDPPGEYIVHTRWFLREYTSLPKTRIERILALLQLCVDARERQPPPTTLTYVRNQAQRYHDYCYICGRSLHDEEPQVEHKWPRALGGSNRPFNLAMACSRCNSAKADYIDASDFHYEEICLTTLDEDDDSFFNELQWQYRVVMDPENWTDFSPQ